MTIRKPWVGGNWKCNGTKASITELATALNKGNFTADKVDAAIFPVALHVELARSKLDKKYIVGTQNISATAEGAFTGEIAVNMVKDFGMEWTLIGHSERRTLYCETDEIAAKKVAAAQAAGLFVSFCIGETLAEREAGKTDEVCARQVEAIIPHVKDWSKIVIAYEPVWAIGTGKVATTEQAQDAHLKIRQLLEKKVSKDVATKTRIVYGGSVSEKNCDELAKMADIDGFLVGGASLKPTFTTIIEAAVKNQQ